MSEKGEPQLNNDETLPIETETENQEQAEREIREWAKKTVQEWHNKVNPDYVFVTETAGVPYGYVLKEAWKAAYQDENRPDFYRIDPRAIPPRSGIGGRTRRHDVKIDAGIKKYFQKRIKKDNANIIVFDEGANSDLRDSFDSVDSRGLSGLEIKEAYNSFVEKSEGKIWVTGGYPKTLGQKFLFGAEKTGGGTASEADYPRNFKRPTSRLYGNKSPYREQSQDEKIARNGETYTRRPKENQDYTLTGAIVKHPEQKKRAMEFVKELKRIGKEAGEELRTELEKQIEN